MLKIGISKIDERKGLPGRSLMMLIGPPGRDKKVFCEQFIYYGLGEGEPAIYICTDRSIRAIRDDMAKFNWFVTDFEAKRMLRFIDCYSWSLETMPPREESVFYTPGPSSLNEIAIALSQAKEQVWKAGKPLRIVLESLSTLFLYNNPDVIFRFIQVIGARAKSADASMLLVLEEGMHEEKIITTIEHLTDLTMVLKIGPISTLKITRVMELEFNYRIKEKGIEAI
jgi:KaiC/GvpD/RAD55 family RecA-like ATPase